MRKNRLAAFLLVCVLIVQSTPIYGSASEASDVVLDMAADSLSEEPVIETPLPEGDDTVPAEEENASNHPQVELMAELPAEPISGYCGGEGDGTNLTWTLDSDGVLTIRGTGKMRDFSNSKDVPWYSYRTSISNVIIGNAVTSIGLGSFFSAAA